MNYAAAFATALNEDLDERGIKKQGPYGVPRVDPSRVAEVHLEGDEGYSYSEYTHADPYANLLFLGEPDGTDTLDGRPNFKYGHTIDMTAVGRIDLGAVMQRAAELMSS